MTSFVEVGLKGSLKAVPLDLCRTSVSEQFAAGDEAAVVRGKEERGARDLVGITHPVERYRRFQYSPEGTVLLLSSGEPVQA